MRAVARCFALGVVLAALLSGSTAALAAGGPPPPTQAQAACIKQAIGASAYGDIFGGRRPPTSAEESKMAACFGGGPSGGSGGQPGGKPGGQTGPTTTTPSRGGCPAVATLLAGVLGAGPAYRAPSWADLTCNTKRLRRLAPPKVAVAVSIDPDFQDRPDAASFRTAKTAANAVAARDRLLTGGWPADLSPQSEQGLPPFTQSYPLPAATLDEQVRNYAALLLREKTAGRRVLFALPAPPSADSALPKTAGEYRTWLASVWLPRVKVAARAAELVKAEYLDPFSPEADIAFNHATWTAMSGADRLATVQDFVNQTRAAASAFKGILVGRQGWQFWDATADQRAFWAAAPMQDLSFKGYGMMGVSLLPVRFNACTPEYAKQYLDVQLPQLTKMAARDGIPWGILELDVFTFGSLTSYGSCGAAPADVQQSIWTAVLDKLKQTNAGVFVFVDAPAEWELSPATLAADKTLFAEFAASVRGR